MARLTKACMNCGETREIAAHGLCFRCYRRDERAIADDLWTKPDGNAKNLAKVQRTTRKALMKMMDALEEIENGKLVPEGTIEAWRKLLRPEVARIAISLGEVEENDQNEDMSEPFTESADETGEPVNSEQERVSELFTEPVGQSGERVNSEHSTASEQFTPPAEHVNQSIPTGRVSAEPMGTEPPLLPPVLPQRATKIKKVKENPDAA